METKGAETLANEFTEFFAELSRTVTAYENEFGAAVITVDLWFLAFLRRMSRFGFFTFGPISVDVELIERIVATTTPRRAIEQTGPAPFGDDAVRFSSQLMTEVRRSQRRRIDELHVLLAFMRLNEGLPSRVFSELGVSAEQIEEYAHNQKQGPVLEKLYSPEEAAEYLNVHVQTVRTWIRTGRLRARRLAGQRALRITASDLQSLLEPLEGEDLDAESRKD